MKYQDLLRALHGYNGLANDGRQLRVVEKECNSVSFKTRGKTMEITVPSMHSREVSDKLVSQIRGSLGAAASQFLYSYGVDQALQGVKDEKLQSCSRTADSIRSSNTLKRQLPGLRADLTDMATAKVSAISKGLREAAPEQLADIPDDSLGYFASAAVAEALASDVPLTKVQDMLSLLPPSVSAKVDEVLESDVLRNMAHANTREESFAAADELYHHFFKGGEQEQEQEQQGKGKGEASPGDKAAAKAMGQPVPGDGDDEQGEDQGKGDDGEGKGDGIKGPEPIYIDGEHGKSKDKDSGEPGNVYSIGKDGYDTYYVTPADKVVWCDYTGRDPKLADVSANSFSPSLPEMMDADAALTGAVRRILQVRSASVYVGGQKRGKLHRGSIYKVGLPTIGNGDFNSRVWKKKQQSDTLDTVVEVLVDFSGSMHGGSKKEAAIAASLQIISCLSKLGIPVGLYGFSDYGGGSTAPLITGVFKHYDSPFYPETIYNGMVHHFRTKSGSNPDACAVYYGLERLRVRREKRKLLLVLSDGCPAACREGDCGAELKRIVKSAPDYGVECYGIGIQSNAVEQYYPEYSVLRNTDELIGCLTSVIKAKLV